ncbi:MAG: MATE family efflux transporter [Clostridia bacterium]|nr:MATE family efflux transporter [Clostridia bacterium]NCC43270.1 MATE family efflux transporter [Clostridia bacterium]
MTAAGNKHSYKEQIKMVIHLSIPAILAEISSVIMQYIDAAMVGSLGAKASASIGLVSSSTWLIGGLCISAATGFSVQVAQLIGAKREHEARDVLKQALLVLVIFGCVLAAVGVGISGSLPKWLGGDTDIHRSATQYFMIYSCALPAIQLRQLSGSMLQCSGDMKTPSILNSVMCGLDVIFNSVLIFPTRQLHIGGFQFALPGAGLGVTGAAIGTALSEMVIAAIMLWFVCSRSEKLRVIKSGKWSWNSKCVRTAVKISLPMAFEHTILCGAQVILTRIVAPLGTIAVAANSLAVTAESVCYMPGFGVSAAATTLVGQRIGADEKNLARSYARISVVMGVGIMTLMGAAMYLLAPLAFDMLTSDPEVRALGVKVLRIEMFAEPFYGMSIVIAGALRGAGDTLVPSIMNLVSMWGIRIVAASLLAPIMGLTGVWVAMCVELCIRGIMFLIRLLQEKWIENSKLV